MVCRQHGRRDAGKQSQSKKSDQMICKASPSFVFPRKHFWTEEGAADI
jgi:hypothetical protein